jgi:hypothetical protein
LVNVDNKEIDYQEVVLNSGNHIGLTPTAMIEMLSVDYLKIEFIKRAWIDFLI